MIAKRRLRQQTAARRRFVGGMNLARPLGSLTRANASMPLAVLTLNQDGVQLRAVAPLYRLMPSVSLPYNEVHGVRRSLGGLTRGVAFETASGIHYFWTLRPGRVLAELALLGCPILDSVRPGLVGLSGFPLRRG